MGRILDRKAKATARLRAGRAPEAETPGWTFLTNHSHVLLCLARDPEISVRQVSLQVGITERSVQRIVAELEAAGYLERNRRGRRNRYAIRRGLALRHPIEMHKRVGDLIAMVLES
jgi:DNA-binding MarR family transcriptional regulator